MRDITDIGRYIGITGVGHADDLAAIQACVEYVPDHMNLMAGVLVNRKTLQGVPAKRPRRYPPIREAAALMHALLSMPRRIWPVVHYCSDTPDSLSDMLAEELAQLREAFDNNNLVGIQLNLHDPSVETVRRFAEAHPGVELILQINPHAFGGRWPTAFEADEYAARFAGLVDHFLLDCSRGSGLPLDAPVAEKLVAIWQRRAGLGIAGGLSWRTMTSLQGLDVSCDAESSLRTPGDALDRGECIRYVAAARTSIGTPTKYLGGIPQDVRGLRRALEELATREPPPATRAAWTAELRRLLALAERLP